MILFDFPLLFFSALGHVITLTAPNRSIEWPNTPRTFKNAFSVKKHVGAVVRVVVRVAIAAENDLLEVVSDPGADQLPPGA